MIGNNPELHSLVNTLNEWAQRIPCIKTVFLYGSRVRGDQRPDSDVDIHIEFDANESIIEWIGENSTDFEDLKRHLPGPLAIHIEKDDPSLRVLFAASQSPALVLGKVKCVVTPRLKL